MQPVNLFNFSEGHLNFSIKIPANISFQIGIIDSWGNQSYVDFPSNQTTYGLVRDGNPNLYEPVYPHIKTEENALLYSLDWIK